MSRDPGYPDDMRSWDWHPDSPFYSVRCKDCGCRTDELDDEGLCEDCHGACPDYELEEIEA